MNLVAATGVREPQLRNCTLLLRKVQLRVLLVYATQRAFRFVPCFYFIREINH